MLEKLRKPTIVIGALGVIKLASEVFFGYTLMSNEDVNAIANGIAAVASIAATLINRTKSQV